MREPKPFWRDVPPDLKEEIEELLGAGVVRGERAFGGFGPSATFRLFLSNGARAFVKGAGLGANEHPWEALPGRSGPSGRSHPVTSGRCGARDGSFSFWKTWGQLAKFPLGLAFWPKPSCGIRPLFT